MEPKQLAASVFEALRIAKQMRAEGKPQAEIDALFERTLRDAWPSIREWTYDCDTCLDTGWQMREGGAAFCWCRKGKALRESQNRKPEPAKPKKPKQGQFPR